ncbi:MAG: hypothetical protein C5B45_03685 [Chlamydiae bacterium]|nr:MAG: hypothetical protein C5B45_03685 [Chlamydiota bacterium]
MSISHPHSLPPLSMKSESDLPDQPLDLSFNSLVIQQFKDQISVQQISKELGLSTDRIYSIISKTSLVKIKDFTRYTSDIKDRVKEARIAG